MGTRWPETCWATCKEQLIRRNKYNTKWHLVGFLFHIELRCTVYHTSNTECRPNRSHVYGAVGSGEAGKAVILGVFASNDMFKVRHSHYGCRTRWKYNYYKSRWTWCCMRHQILVLCIQRRITMLTLHSLCTMSHQIGFVLFRVTWLSLYCILLPQPPNSVRLCSEALMSFCLFYNRRRRQNSLS